MPYYDDELVRQLTAEAIERTGSRLLQMHRIGENDLEHTRALLNLFDFPQGARIADIGCGVGDLALTMQAERPDLNFVLVNPSLAQLRMCPDDFAKVLACGESLPFERGDVDALMVTYALGHMDLVQFALQAMRILAPGQKLCIFDLFKLDASQPCQLAEDLNYAERTLYGVLQAFDHHRFDATAMQTATHLPEATAALLPNPNTLDNTFSVALVLTRRKK